MAFSKEFFATDFTWLDSPLMMADMARLNDNTLPKEQTLSSGVAPGAATNGASSPSLVSAPAATQPQLDELDWKILAELALDARNAFQGIAEKLGVDEKTVRNRISRLRTANTVQFLTLLDANQCEKCFVLLAGIQATPEARASGADFGEQLAALPATSWCGRVIGRFDYMLEAVFPTLADLREFESKVLPTFPGVQSAESFFVVSHHGDRKIPIFPLTPSSAAKSPR